MRVFLLYRAYLFATQRRAIGVRTRDPACRRHETLHLARQNLNPNRENGKHTKAQGKVKEIRANAIRIARRAEFLLVVENDALLNTLAEEKFTDRTPCVATRVFIKKMRATNRHIPTYILCDFDPRCGGVYV